MTSFDEGVRAGMEKAAASVEELQAAYNRGNIIRMTRGGARATGADGPFHMSSNKDALKALHMKAREWKQFPEKEKKILEDMSLLRPDSNIDGKTFMTRRGVGPLNDRASLRARTGAGWRAQNILVGLHEVGERRASQRQTVWDYWKEFGHASPKVIFDEHNLAKKMTGPGSDEARRWHVRTRTVGGELGDVKDMVNRHYGAKGWDYVKKNGFSRAMKKDLIRKYQQQVGNVPRSLLKAMT